MKILQVTPYFKPMWESGGVTRVAYDVSKHLSDCGHEVTVYTTNMFLNPTDVDSNVQVDVDGMKVYYFENLRKYFKGINLPVIPYYLPIVAKKEIQNFDIIHIHEHRTLLAVIVAYYARKYDVPYVVQAHGSLPYLIGAKYFKITFDLFLGNKILKKASNLIALTKKEVEQYRKISIEERKIEIIPNGINLENFEKRPQKGSFKQKNNISEDKKIILFLGRIDKIKGIDILIKAFHDLSKSIEGIELIIVGPDVGYLNELKENVKFLNIEDKVIFTGPLYGEEKLEAYVDADLYVLPSRYETFPMTILEAFATETPVITTNNCGLSDTILSNEAGRVINFNLSELTEAIKTLLSNNEIKEKYCNNGRKLLHNNYLSSIVILKYIKLYQEIIGDKK